MEPERRKRILMAASLIVALGVVAYFVWPRPSATASPASKGRGAAGAIAQATPPMEAPDVHLQDLHAARPKPVDVERNLFRFKTKPPPLPPPQPNVVEAPVTIAPPVPTGPPTPPPPPLITLKYLGFVNRSGEKFAILSDSTGRTEHGKEGAEIAGRYRILKIGVESVEIAYTAGSGYPEGSGRRTIRVSGS
jgi:hypothetical protein